MWARLSPGLVAAALASRSWWTVSFGFRPRPCAVLCLRRIEADIRDKRRTPSQRNGEGCHGCCCGTGITPFMVPGATKAEPVTGASGAHRVGNPHGRVHGTAGEQ
jgi:hypothetical protein